MAKAKQDMKRGFAASFLALLRSKDNINVRNVRVSHLKYMLIFPLAPVFANMQGVLFSDSIQLFNLDAMTLMGSAYCVGAGVLFAFTSTKNMALVSKMSALITAAANRYCPQPPSRENRRVYGAMRACHCAASWYCRASSKSQ